MAQNDTEQNSFGRRAARYANVTRKVSGVGAKFIGQKYLGLSIDNERHAQDLKNALGGLKGPIMKVAQILATVPGALPEEYMTELRQLQSEAPAMGWLFVKRRMKAELGNDWQSMFDDFSHDAVHAASLGQVHKAKKEGQDLACKLQYPDMESAVEADLRQLKFILKLYHQYDKAIDTSAVYQELSDRLREELDYDREAKNMALYALMLKQEKEVHVPTVWPELSTQRLITMDWLQGEKILTFVDSPLEQRNTIAMNMFRAWYVPFYHYGIIHGDPHLGNYSVAKDNNINLLDFGCIRIFPPDFVAGVLDLYTALRTDDRDRAVAAYESWGFENLTNEIIDILNVWANFVYAPIMEDKTRKMDETNSGDYGRAKAAEVHRLLRETGGVKPPREFVLMDRAALGLGSVFLHLQAEINWYRLFHELIENFDVKKLSHNQSNALSTVEIKK